MQDQIIIISSYFDACVTEQENKVVLPNPSHLEAREFFDLKCVDSGYCLSDFSDPRHN